MRHLSCVAAKTGKTSRYWGVTLFASQGKFQAFLKIDGRRIHCGMWMKDVDAAIARDRAVLHFGIGSALNFPRKAPKLGPASPADLIAQAKTQQRARESSPYLGVHWDSRRSRWAAIICIGRDSVQIAQFDEAADAADAYDRVALDLFGKDAERNFPRRRLKPASIEAMRVWARCLWKEQTSSRYRGVAWYSRHECWRAQICIEGRHIGLGYFDSEEEAAMAYDREARRVWGPGARVNFG